MPKVKSNSGAKKRFKFTASGKIKRKKAYRSHILTKKSPKRKRNLRSATLVDDANAQQIRNLLPYAK
ncbi:MAG TPA: 50S ribosomal protein L35 [Balneolales bacterium]|nr:50S ribosomal protein L35 [Balneolales bacterium]